MACVRSWEEVEASESADSYRSLTRTHPTPLFPSSSLSKGYGAAPCLKKASPHPVFCASFPTANRVNPRFGSTLLHRLRATTAITGKPVNSIETIETQLKLTLEI